MARIEPLAMSDVTPEIRHICEDAERQAGTSASPRTYGKNPAVLTALAAFRAALGRDGTLDPVLRELVRLKIAGLIELAVHTTLFIGLGRFNEVIGLDPA